MSQATRQSKSSQLSALVTFRCGPIVNEALSLDSQEVRYALGVVAVMREGTRIAITCERKQARKLLRALRRRQTTHREQTPRHWARTLKSAWLALYDATLEGVARGDARFDAEGR